MKFDKALIFYYIMLSVWAVIRLSMITMSIYVIFFAKRKTRLNKKFSQTNMKARFS